jgi:hypothetical protein
MKTKNQTEHDLLELAVATAANEDGISPAGRDSGRDTATTARMQAWSPLEVWRTRVKAAAHTDLPKIQG